MKKLLLVLLLTYGCSDAPPEEEWKLSEPQKTSLNKLIADNLLEVQQENNEAFIMPDVWASMDHKTKEAMSTVCAIYCENKKQNRLYYCTIYDKMSGKKLAKYSSVYGFEVY